MTGLESKVHRIDPGTLTGCVFGGFGVKHERTTDLSLLCSWVPDRNYANFGELRQGEVRRIYLLRGWVNKPPVDAPEPSGWHHGHGVDPLLRY